MYHYADYPQQQQQARMCCFYLLKCNRCNRNTDTLQNAGKARNLHQQRTAANVESFVHSGIMSRYIGNFIYFVFYMCL